MRRGPGTLLATAAALALLAASVHAQALELGAIAMRSALGEPLRAEIEVLEIGPEEAATLQAMVASPATFDTVGVKYSPALAGVRVSLQQGSSGQAHLQLASDQPVHESSLPVVVEASWAGGHIVRNYTMLVDPPAHAGAPPPVLAAAAEVTPPPATTLPAPPETPSETPSETPPEILPETRPETPRETPPAHTAPASSPSSAEANAAPAESARPATPTPPAVTLDSAAGTPTPAPSTPTAAASIAAAATPSKPAAPASAASAVVAGAASANASAGPGAATRTPSALESLPSYPELLWAGGGLLMLLAMLALHRSRQRRRDTETSDRPFTPPGTTAGLGTSTEASDTSPAVGGDDPGTPLPAVATATPPTQDTEASARASAIIARDRDAQVEQTLKEAVRDHRSLVPNHRKLAAIYARRGDAQALESIAAEAFDITQGEGPDWRAIASLGRQLDPDNLLYALGDGTAAPASIPPRKPAPGAGATAAASGAPSEQSLDDLFISLDLELEPGTAPAGPTGLAPPQASFEPLDFELDLDPTAPIATTTPPDDEGSIGFTLDDAIAADPTAPAIDPRGTAFPGTPDDPLAAKLERARRLQASGDLPAARELLTEVIGTASGTLRHEAEQLLATLY